MKETADRREEMSFLNNPGEARAQAEPVHNPLSDTFVQPLAPSYIKKIANAVRGVFSVVSEGGVDDKQN